MGFLNPVNLLYAAGIAVLVAIYFRSRSRATVEVSSLALFEEAPAPVSRVRKLRTDLLFWLEVAALTALVLALAGFYVRSEALVGKGRNRALVFDLGAAMGAHGVGQTRLDLAKRKAVRMILSAPERDNFTLIGYALDARQIHPRAGGRRALVAAVEALRPTDVASTPGALAAALMRVQTARRIDVFSDRPLPETALTGSAAASRVRFHRVGVPLDNLAIVSLDAGSPGNSPGTVVVKNFSAATHDCELTVTRAGKRVLDRTLVLGPGEQVRVRFGPLGAGGLVRARIVTGDALMADNQRFALAPLAKAAPVLVLSESPAVRDDLARVILAVNSDFIVTAADPAQFKPSSAEGRTRYRLAVMDDCFLGWVKADSLLLVYPPRMGPVAKGRLAGLTVGPSLNSAWMLQDTDGDEGPEIGPVRVVRMPDWMTATVRGETAGARLGFPLAAVGTIPEGRFGFMAFDVRDHLLLDPDKLEALITAVNLVRRLTAPADTRVVSTGTYLNVAVHGAARVTDPEGVVATLKPDRWGRVRLRPMLAGRYRVESGGQTVNVYANYYSAFGSNLDLVAVANGPRASFARASAQPVPAVSNKVRPLATLLVALALVAIIGESIVLVRRALCGRGWHV